MSALNVDRITKRFNTVTAVDDISFRIEEGRMFGLLGPNGAGKTTTMRMIVNIILPDAGHIELFDRPFDESLKSEIGYLPEERGMYPKMKLLDHLQFLGEIKGMRAAAARQDASTWLKRFELDDRADKRINELSKGLQQKAQIIGTILHRPRLLIVDEPFSGLDPLNTRFLLDLLLELRREGTTIILSTHLMDQAERLCEEICLINRGRIVLAGDLADLKRAHGRNRVLLETDADAAMVRHHRDVSNVNDYGQHLEIRLHEGVTADGLLKTLVEAGVAIRRFETADISLNELFIERVGAPVHERDS